MQPEDDSAAVPAVSPEDDSGPARHLKCDGEEFELRPNGSGGTHYAWLSGPNPGYGFSSSAAPDDEELHVLQIRGFLSMIDPRTGYIGD